MVPLAKHSWALPYDLLSSILDGNCVMFVGAGLSSSAIRTSGKPLPNWGGLLRELIQTFAGAFLTTGEVAGLMEGLDRRKYLDVAQSLEDSVPLAEMQAAFRDIFGDLHLTPTPNHLLLPDIRLRAVLTSNYDSLVEDAYQKHSGSLPLTLTFDNYAKAPCPIRNRRFFVLKVHGDYKEYGTVVLGTRSYRRLIHYHPLARFVLQNLLASQTFVFVGYGGSDPDLDQVIDELATVFEYVSAPHYLVVPAGRFSQLERRRLLLDRRIHVVEYDPRDQHTELQSLIQTLTVRSLATYLETTQFGVCQVFVSAHRLDIPFLEPLLDHLQARGGSFIISTPDTVPRDSLDRIRGQVERSSVVLHVYSKNYFDELSLVMAMAQDSKRPQVNFLLDKLDPPHLLKNALCCRPCEHDPGSSIAQLGDLLLQFRGVVS